MGATNQEKQKKQVNVFHEVLFFCLLSVLVGYPSFMKVEGWSLFMVRLIFSESIFGKYASGVKHLDSEKIRKIYAILFMELSI